MAAEISCLPQTHLPRDVRHGEAAPLRRSAEPLPRTVRTRLDDVVVTRDSEFLPEIPDF